MNILILSESLAVGGGAEKFAVTLGNQLHNNGHQITYLTYEDSPDKYDFNGNYYSFNENNKENGLVKVFNFFKKPYKIKKICNENSVDVIISVGEGPNLKAILSKFLFGNNRIIIATHHLNPEIHFNNKILFNEIKFLYPKADKVVCVSRAIENILINKLDVHNTQTIYNMSNIESCIERSQEEIQPEDQKYFDSGFVFINIGRLSVQKGHFFLIRSFKGVVEKYDHAKLLILGDGDLKSVLVELVKELDLEDNVFFLGNQNNVFSFLRKSDSFVLSSLVEGFPLTLIETLAMEIPIISTDCKTGPRECLCPELDPDETIKYPYYGKYGMLVTPIEFDLSDNSVSQALNTSELMLKNMMIKMVEDPNLRLKYSNGLERARKFDEKVIIDKWEELIQKL